MKLPHDLIYDHICTFSITVQPTPARIHFLNYSDINHKRILVGFTRHSCALSIKFLNYNKCELHMKGLSYKTFLFAMFYE